MFDGEIVVPGKLAYVRKPRPAGGCILCGIVKGAGGVVRLLVHESSCFRVSLNLHPYNPGHLMIFPVRHVTDPRELRAGEEAEERRLVHLALDVLDGLYGPPGYNVGCNIGRPAGASIEHLHLHVIPRYPNELGVLDLIGRKRVIVEDPRRTLRRVRAAFRRAAAQPPARKRRRQT